MVAVLRRAHTPTMRVRTKLTLLCALTLLVGCKPAVHIPSPTIAPTAVASPTLEPNPTETLAPATQRVKPATATRKATHTPTQTQTLSPTPEATLTSAVRSGQVYLPWVTRPFGYLPDWTHVTWGPFNLVDPPGVTNPVLTGLDVTDRFAQTVADPFLFHEYWPWYMFFEVFDIPTDQGDIGLATSLDGLHWTYDQIVLDEPFHLSYPYIFKVEESYYMIPETYQLGEVRIYQAESFPDKWTYLVTVLTGREFVDPSIIFYGGRWWLFVGEVSNTTLYLFSSDSLTDDWVEHPQSPIVLGDTQHARPGGQFLIYNDDQIIRFSQSWGNGIKIRAYQVDVLTTEQYLEHELTESPLLEAGSNPGEWYAEGMHHFAPWWMGHAWLVAYDGRASNGEFSIGIKLAIHP